MRGESPEWQDEGFDLMGYDVGVRQLWEDRNGGQNKDLPLKMNAHNVAQLKDSLRVLCLVGGPCWPTEVKPLQDGQSYGVWFRRAGTQDSKWLAVVGCPENDE